MSFDFTGHGEENVFANSSVSTKRRGWVRPELSIFVAVAQRVQGYSACRVHLLSHLKVSVTLLQISTGNTIEPVEFCIEKPRSNGAL